MDFRNKLYNFIWKEWNDFEILSILRKWTIFVKIFFFFDNFDNLISCISVCRIESFNMHDEIIEY